MAITYAIYDPSKPVGASIARAAALLTEGRAELDTAFSSCNVATDAGTDTTQLVGGPFGALDATNAERLWTALNTVKTLLDGDDAGGLGNMLASIYNGKSG